MTSIRDKIGYICFADSAIVVQIFLYSDKF